MKNQCCMKQKTFVSTICMNSIFYECKDTMNFSKMNKNN